MIDMLLKTLDKLGLSVHLPEDLDERTPEYEITLLLRGPADAKTPTVMASLKEFKPMIVSRLLEKRRNQQSLDHAKNAKYNTEEGVQCQTCKATLYGTREEIRETVSNPHLCGQTTCPFR